MDVSLRGARREDLNVQRISNRFSVCPSQAKHPSLSNRVSSFATAVTTPQVTLGGCTTLWLKNLGRIRYSSMLSGLNQEQISWKESMSLLACVTPCSLL